MDNLPLGFSLICGGFFFLIILAGGVGLLVFSRRSQQKADASLGWPSTNATIILSEVTESVSRDEDGDTSTYYLPHVVFSYVVGGQSYTSQVIAFGGKVGRSNPSQVQAELAQYPVGAVVPAYYNPAKPEEAVLERKASGGAKTARNGGIFLLALAGMIACILLFSLIRNFS